MMYTYNMVVVVSVVLMVTICCLATTKVDEKLTDNKKNASITTDNKDESVKLPDNHQGKYFNYLRLPDGECHNCSTYKCTKNKANMGGSEWCIMLFPAALAHCDSDPNCGGYTMTTAEWFHKQHDKNGQIAVHLTKAGEKLISCPVGEWSSYEKQSAIRDTPAVYGKSTCGNSNQDTCAKLRNFNYVFESNSNAAGSVEPFLCENHPNNLDSKERHCVLPIVDGVTVCNSDDQCEGFMINTDENWQKKFSTNGMQAVQLFRQGVTYTPSQTWRSFKKQH